MSRQSREEAIDRAIAVAATMVRPDGAVNVAAVERICDFKLHKYLPRLRDVGRWPWPPVIRMADLPGPDAVAIVLAGCLEGMGDGRHEVDDPREHGVMSIPRSGKDHRRKTVSLRRLARKYYREWREVRRRQASALPMEVSCSR
jgi:hypothetical protein